MRSRRSCHQRAHNAHQPPCMPSMQHGRPTCGNQRLPGGARRVRRPPHPEPTTRIGSDEAEMARNHHSSALIAGVVRCRIRGGWAHRAQRRTANGRRLFWNQHAMSREGVHANQAGMDRCCLVLKPIGRQERASRPRDGLRVAAATPPPPPPPLLFSDHARHARPRTHRAARIGRRISTPPTIVPLHAACRPARDRRHGVDLRCPARRARCHMDGRSRRRFGRRLERGHDIRDGFRRGGSRPGRRLDATAFRRCGTGRRGARRHGVLPPHHLDARRRGADHAHGRPAALESRIGPFQRRPPHHRNRRRAGHRCEPSRHALGARRPHGRAARVHLRRPR